MGKQGSKVAIIGSGFVGSSAAFAMAHNGLASEVVLIDVNKEKAFGEAMDINHGISYLGQINIHSGDYDEVKDCDVIVITAGANRKPGETRLDLAKKNVAIMKDITTNIMKHYNGGVIVVVSNPVDVLAYMVQKWTGLPKGMVMSSGTNLDSARFRYFISKKLNVDVRNVHGYMIGEHGDSQLPFWSATHVAGKGLEECHLLTEEEKAEIVQEVRQAGATIIKNKGATYYAIAISINRIVESILKDQKTIIPVAVVLDGEYGVSDVALSLPCVVGRNGVERMFDIDMTEEELKGFRASAEAVKAVLNEVKDV
ncbi:MAG: L-lactate dehydrogenase [Clostridia bacterium]|nr:L-lactate dehydrogenase [Clostridia bacterium]